MSICQVFERFPDLPGELRNKIYRLLPYVTRRVTEVNVLSNYEDDGEAPIDPLIGPTRQLQSKPMPLPPFLRDSREMRAELRPSYEILLPFCKTALVKFAADIIFFKSEATSVFRQALENSSPAALGQLSEIAKVQSLLLVYVTEHLVNLVWRLVSAHMQFFNLLVELNLRIYPSELQRWRDYVESRQNRSGKNKIG